MGSSIGTSILPETIYPPSPQMPPTSMTSSIECQTDSVMIHDQQCQTSIDEYHHQSIQTEPISIDEQSHSICRDLTTCQCAQQLIKTHQFIQDVSMKQYPFSSKISQQTMTESVRSLSSIVLARSSLKAEQQVSSQLDSVDMIVYHPSRSFSNNFLVIFVSRIRQQLMTQQHI
jgi:hypothetical protein